MLIFFISLSSRQSAMKTSIIVVMILLTTITREAYMQPDNILHRDYRHAYIPDYDTIEQHTLAGPTTTEKISTTTESIGSLLKRYIALYDQKHPSPVDRSKLQAIEIEMGKREKKPNGEIKRQPLTVTLGTIQSINETRRKRLVYDLDYTLYGPPNDVHQNISITNI